MVRWPWRDGTEAEHSKELFVSMSLRGTNVNELFPKVLCFEFACYGKAVQNCYAWRDCYYILAKSGMLPKSDDFCAWYIHAGSFSIICSAREIANWLVFYCDIPYYNIPP